MIALSSVITEATHEFQQITSRRIHPPLPPLSSRRDDARQSKAYNAPTLSVALTDCFTVHSNSETDMTSPGRVGAAPQSISGDALLAEDVSVAVLVPGFHRRRLRLHPLVLVLLGDGVVITDSDFRRAHVKL